MTLEQIWQRLVVLCGEMSICEACGAKVDARWKKVVCSNTECMAEMEGVVFSDAGKISCITCGGSEVVPICPECRSEDLFPRMGLDDDILLLVRDIGRSLGKGNPLG